MKYNATLPLTALFALSLISLLVYFELVPPGMDILQGLKGSFGGYFYLLILIVILLESIVYVGFYFPGQFFAVVLVVLSEPQTADVLLLTLAMVTAATIGSGINFYLGRHFGTQQIEGDSISLKRLMLAMIHINSLAFFMFFQGANRQPVKIIALAGVLNLPYYLLLIFATAVLSEQVMLLAESTWLLITLVSVWLAVASYLDFKKYRRTVKPI
ncbi:MAG: membrane-associated protein [Paraglaciecola sp.]|jgi:membrane-associated protein